MLDRDTNNHSEFEGAFTDRAWSDMKALLDKEMPVDMPPPVPQAGKNYLLLLLFLVIGFAAGAGVFVAYSSMQEKEPEAPPKRVPIAQSVPIEANRLAKAVPSTEAEVTAALKDELHNAHQTLTSSAASNYSISKSQNLSLAYAATPTLNTPSITNNVTTTVTSAPKSQGLPLADTQQQAQNQSSPIDGDRPAFFEAIIPEDNTGSTAVVLEDVATIPLVMDELTADRIEPVMTLATLPKKNIRLGLAASRHLNSKLGGKGYSVGPMVEFQLDPKFSIRTGINYTHIENSGEEKNVARLLGLNADVTEPDSGSGLYQDLEKNYSTYDVASMDYITVPALLAFNFNPKFTITAGLEFAYLLGTQFGSQNDELALTPTNERGVANIDDGIRKANLAAQIGIGYYPTEKVGMDLSYNFGMLDYSKDDYFGVRQNDTHQYMKLSLNYFFSRR